MSKCLKCLQIYNLIPKDQNTQQPQYCKIERSFSTPFYVFLPNSIRFQLLPGPKILLNISIQNIFPHHSWSLDTSKMPLDAVSVFYIKHDIEVLSLSRHPTYINTVCVPNIYIIYKPTIIRLYSMGGGDIVMNKEMVHSDIWTGVIYLVFVSSAHLVTSPRSPPGLHIKDEVRRGGRGGKYLLLVDVSTNIHFPVKDMMEVFRKF